MQEKPVVLLLAGGKSIRFWPLTEKNTYPFLGKNLVEKHIETLKELGFHDLIVVASEKVFDWLVEHSQRFADFNINYVRQSEGVKGMAGAVLSAVENFRTHYPDRSLYILNCNDIYDKKVHEEILNRYENRKEVQIFITGYKVKEYLPLGYLVLEGGKVTGIKEKPGKEKMPSDLANIVVHLFRQPEVFLKKLEEIAEKKSEDDDIYEQALDAVFKIQETEAIKYEGRWEILKYPWHVLSVMDYYLSQIQNNLIDPSAKISEKAIIGDNVVISEGVQVFEGAKIEGPCYIGKNTIVGNNSLIRDSIIGDNCVIGFSSEVARSYLGNEIWLHTNYIGDSILEKNVSLGSGSVTGNLRLDEEVITVKVNGEKVMTGQNKLGMIVGQNVRFGINTSIMPGVKVGAGSFIGPGVILNQDLAENSFCKIKQELEIKKNKENIKKRPKFDK